MGDTCSFILLCGPFFGSVHAQHLLEDHGPKGEEPQRLLEYIAGIQDTLSGHHQDPGHTEDLDGTLIRL